MGGGVRVRVMLEVNAQSMQRCVHLCGSGRMGRRQGGVLLCCVQVVRNRPCRTAAWGEEKGTCHMLPIKEGRLVMRGPRRVHARCSQESDGGRLDGLSACSLLRPARNHKRSPSGTHRPQLPSLPLMPIWQAATTTPHSVRRIDLHPTPVSNAHGPFGVRA